ncbi:hypothetical protein MMC21_000727 [Puttea exsequens]|nr:hypothetical protein [Puttea exsequens]
MGKLIKNHWARLIILTASTYQILASIQGFFWPKLFWDFLTTNLDPCVRPIPILQIVNLLLGLLGVCWEYPLPLFTTAATGARLSHNHNHSNNHHNANSTSKEGGVHKHSTSTASAGSSSQPSRFDTLAAAMHRSIEARLVVYPLSSLAAFLLYQGTNAGFYYLIGMGIYFWAFSEGEVVMGVPWTLPKRGKAMVRAQSRV